MFLKIKHLKKFTTKTEIDDLIGKPKFQIENRPVYYYGKGTLVAYTSHCFKVIGNDRVEYGEEGEYAVSVYHFQDVEMLKIHFGLDYFEENDMQSEKTNLIDEEITYGKTFKEIQNMKLYNIWSKHYMEGETRRLIDGKMQVVNLFIMYGTCTLFFRGKSKKNTVSGVEYTLRE